MAQTRNKYATVNLNSSYAKPASSSQGRPQSQASPIGTKSGGMLILRRSRGRAGPQLTSKLVVPKPVNLPSLKKEHAGNDPTISLVQSAGSGVGWLKAGRVQDQEQPSTADLSEAPQGSRSALTAGSTWGGGTQTTASSQLADLGDGRPSVEVVGHGVRPGVYAPPQARRAAASGKGYAGPLVREEFPTLTAAVTTMQMQQRAHEEAIRQKQVHQQELARRQKHMKDEKGASESSSLHSDSQGLPHPAITQAEQGPAVASNDDAFPAPSLGTVKPSGPVLRPDVRPRRLPSPPVQRRQDASRLWEDDEREAPRASVDRMDDRYGQGLHADDFSFRRPGSADRVDWRSSGRGRFGRSSNSSRGEPLGWSPPLSSSGGIFPESEYEFGPRFNGPGPFLDRFPVEFDFDLLGRPSSHHRESRPPGGGLLKGAAKDAKKEELRDPVRDAFEAEMARVQELQEQERQRKLDEKRKEEEMLRKAADEEARLAKGAQEKREAAAREVEEARLRAEEALQREEDLRKQRLAEKKQEEELELVRKDRARKKLQELEGRINHSGQPKDEEVGMRRERAGDRSGEDAASFGFRKDGGRGDAGAQWGATAARPQSGGHDGRPQSGDREGWSHPMSHPFERRSPVQRPQGYFEGRGAGHYERFDRSGPGGWRNGGNGPFDFGERERPLLPTPQGAFGHPGRGVDFHRWPPYRDRITDREFREAGPPYLGGPGNRRGNVIGQGRGREGERDLDGPWRTFEELKQGPSPSGREPEQRLDEEHRDWSDRRQLPWAKSNRVAIPPPPPLTGRRPLSPDENAGVPLQGGRLVEGASLGDPEPHGRDGGNGERGVPVSRLGFQGSGKEYVELLAAPPEVDHDSEARGSTPESPHHTTVLTPPNDAQPHGGVELVSQEHPGKQSVSSMVPASTVSMPLGEELEAARPSPARPEKGCPGNGPGPHDSLAGASGIEATRAMPLPPPQSVTSAAQDPLLTPFTLKHQFGEQPSVSRVAEQAMMAQPPLPFRQNLPAPATGWQVPLQGPGTETDGSGQPGRPSSLEQTAPAPPKSAWGPASTCTPPVSGDRGPQSEGPPSASQKMGAAAVSPSPMEQVPSSGHRDTGDARLQDARSQAGPGDRSRSWVPEHRPGSAPLPARGKGHVLAARGSSSYRGGRGRGGPPQTQPIGRPVSTGELDRVGGAVKPWEVVVAAGDGSGAVIRTKRRSGPAVRRASKESGEGQGNDRSEVEQDESSVAVPQPAEIPAAREESVTVGTASMEWIADQEAPDEFQSGIVHAYEQSGVETDKDGTGFKKVVSRRDRLMTRREQKEKEDRERVRSKKEKPAKVNDTKTAPLRPAQKPTASMPGVSPSPGGPAAPAVATEGASSSPVPPVGASDMLMLPAQGQGGIGQGLGGIGHAAYGPKAPMPAPTTGSAGLKASTSPRELDKKIKAPGRSQEASASSESTSFNTKPGTAAKSIWGGAHAAEQEEGAMLDVMKQCLPGGLGGVLDTVPRPKAERGSLSPSPAGPLRVGKSTPPLRRGEPPSAQFGVVGPVQPIPRGGDEDGGDQEAEAAASAVVATVIDESEDSGEKRGGDEDEVDADVARVVGGLPPGGAGRSPGTGRGIGGTAQSAAMMDTEMASRLPADLSLEPALAAAGSVKAPSVRQRGHLQSMPQPGGMQTPFSAGLGIGRGFSGFPPSDVGPGSGGVDVPIMPGGRWHPMPPQLSIGPDTFTPPGMGPGFGGPFGVPSLMYLYPNPQFGPMSQFGQFPGIGLVPPGAWKQGAGGSSGMDPGPPGLQPSQQKTLQTQQQQPAAAVASQRGRGPGPNLGAASGQRSVGAKMGQQGARPLPSLDTGFGRPFQQALPHPSPDWQRRVHPSPPGTMGGSHALNPFHLPPSFHPSLHPHHPGGLLPQSDPMHRHPHQPQQKPQADIGGGHLDGALGPSLAATSLGARQAARLPDSLGFGDTSSGVIYGSLKHPAQFHQTRPGGGGPGDQVAAGVSPMSLPNQQSKQGKRRAQRPRSAGSGSLPNGNETSGVASRISPRDQGLEPPREFVQSPTPAASSPNQEAGCSRRGRPGSGGSERRSSPLDRGHGGAAKVKQVYVAKPAITKVAGDKGLEQA